MLPKRQLLTFFPRRDRSSHSIAQILAELLGLEHLIYSNLDD